MFDEKEDEALQGLPHRAQLLYLRVLRRHMDYSTGVVGVKRKISRQQMREVLEVIQEMGPNAGHYQPTVKEIRVSLEQLKRAGLIVELEQSKGGSPKYLLPLAKVDENRSGGQIRLLDIGPGLGPDIGPDIGPGKSGDIGPGVCDVTSYIYGKKSRKRPDIGPGKSADLGPDLGPDIGPDLGPTSVNTVLYCTVPDGNPVRPADIEQVLIDWCRFPLRVVRTAKTIPLYRAWIDGGMSYEDLHDAVVAAHEQLQAIPDSPTYYRNFVHQVLVEKARLREGGTDDNEKRRPAVQRGGRADRSSSGTASLWAGARGGLRGTPYDAAGED